MKQTAVEWLKKQLESYGDPSNLKLDWETLDELIEQAKEMEETMVCDGWDDGYEKGLRTREEKITDPVFNAKHYYDTKYKKEEQ